MEAVVVTQAEDAGGFDRVVTGKRGRRRWM